MVTLEAIGNLEAVRSDWTRLSEASGNLFATWEWADCWWRHIGRGRELELAVGRDGDGAARFLLPLYAERTGDLRVLRLLGRGESDEPGVICAPADRSAGCAALEARLKETDDWDAFVGDDLPRWHQVRGAGSLRRTPSPLLRLRGRSWEELLAERSRNFRQQVGKRLRRLERNWTVRFRRADDPARLDADVDILLALHAARWGDRSRSFADVRQAFHREFAALALERGWLCLRLLELDETPVAAIHNFRFGGAEWCYQVGRDPDYDRWSVGFVLQVHAIKQAIEDGLGEYRLLRGGEPYKQRFANEDPGLHTVGLARTAAGDAWLKGSEPLERRAAPPEHLEASR